MSYLLILFAVIIIAEAIYIDFILKRANRRLEELRLELHNITCHIGAVVKGEK